MAASLLQTVQGNGGGYNNTNVQAMSSVTAGTKIVLSVVAGSANTIASIADTRSNTYALIDAEASSDRQLWLYYAENANSGANTVTVTFGAGEFVDSVAIIQEWDGLDSGYDVAAAGNDGSGFVQSHTTAATATTAQAAELVISVAGTNGSVPVGFSAGTGYGNLVSQDGFDDFTYGMLQRKTVSATGTFTGDYSTVEFVTGAQIVATFKITASSAYADAGIAMFRNGVGAS